MKKVNQSVIERGKGDCVLACLASIFELPLEEIPRNLCQNYTEQCKWLSKRGLTFMEIPRASFNAMMELGESVTPVSTNWVYVMLSVPSQMFEGGTHAIVGRLQSGGIKIVHDPNPNNAPYSPADVTDITFFVHIGGELGIS